MASNALVHKSLVVNGTIEAVNEACNQILADVKANRFNKEDIFAIHLALEEAFLNSIKHGNSEDPTKEINIEYFITSEKFDVSISDDGEGFSPDTIPDPCHEENLHKPYGRGVLLMRAYMDNVAYNSTGNSVHMIKYKS